MENRRDIGKLFREKLDDLDKSPNGDLWAKINADLQKDKKKRRIIPFWLKTTGIAVVMMVLLVISSQSIWNKNSSFQLFEENNNSKNKSSGNQKDENDAKNQNSITNSNNLKNTEESNKEVITLKKESSDKPSSSHNILKSLNDSTDKKSPSSIKKHTKEKLISSNTKFKKRKVSNRKFDKNIVFAIKETEKNSDLKSFDITEKSSQNLESSKIASVSDIKNDSIKKAKKDKTLELTMLKDKKDSLDDSSSSFYIFGHISPSYFNMMSKKSVVDSDLNDTKTSSEIELNYGIYIGTKINEKLSLRVGINNVKFNLKTENIQIATSIQADVNTGYFSNINYNSGLTNARIAEMLGDSIIDIKQKLHYLEIPIEAKYNFVTKKNIGIEAIAGFSTLYLKDNSVIAEAKNLNTTDIGSIKNMRGLSFSANLGIGFNYKIFKNLQFNLESIFKYHINSFEEKVKPFSFNVQTGLQYNFTHKGKNDKKNK